MTNSVNLYIIVEKEGVLQIKQDAFFLIIKVISGRYNRERLCKNAAPKVTAKTLRQKDRLWTELWRAVIISTEEAISKHRDEKYRG